MLAKKTNVCSEIGWIDIIKCNGSVFLEKTLNIADFKSKAIKLKGYC